MKVRLLAFLVGCLFTLAAFAQSWPAKPVRWIVPFPPGGPADVVARLTAAKLGERVGQPNIVENRPGAGGNIAHAAVAASAPDGYTVLFTVTGLVSNMHFFKGSPDPAEFAGVVQFNTASLVLVTHPAFPAKNVGELIAHARAKPGAVTCASAGALPQVCCEILKAHLKGGLLLVPYKGNAPGLTAVMSGETDLIFDLPNTALGQVRAGKVRALATTAPKRGQGPFGELPVMVESIPEFDIATWQGLTVPRATPRDLVQRINRELNAVLAEPEVRKRFNDAGLEVVGGTPEAFDQHLRNEAAKYNRILTAAGVKPE